MSRRIECEEYRSWKREQARKSSGRAKKVTREKRKGPTIDCVDEEDDDLPEKNEFGIGHRRCDEAKRVETRQPGRRSFKRVSLTDVLFERIRPSMVEREQLLNQRHAACLHDKTAGVDPVESITTSLRRSSDVDLKRKHRPIRRRRAKKPALRGENKSDETNAENIASEGKSEDEVEGNGETTDKKAAGRTEGESKAKRKKVKGKSRRKRIAQTYSVCSFDSEVCLAGVVLTSEDRKKIDEFRRQAESADDP